jgi:hypothetical protein
MIMAAIIASAHKITDTTKTIHTTATKLSRVMDTSGGGPVANGGFHRILGGHDFWDIDMWSRYGLEFPKELFKDVITPNGLPLPGAKEAIEKLGISVQSVQDWGCINIGEFIGGGISFIDSGLKVKKYISGDVGCDIEASEYVSLLMKCAIATGTTNPIVAGSALSDATLLIKRAYDQSFDDQFNYSPLSYED